MIDLGVLESFPRGALPITYETDYTGTLTPSLVKTVNPAVWQTATPYATYTTNTPSISFSGPSIVFIKTDVVTRVSSIDLKNQHITATGLSLLLSSLSTLPSFTGFGGLVVDIRNNGLTFDAGQESTVATLSSSKSIYVIAFDYTFTPTVTDHYSYAT